ncbi:hypothetical protein LGK95_11815 [Clostridium algoriphilum]|uniref:hypothetical protein n=1 Tax=Clostridium algoriphilum TaxID=198347 RepID=UPI001CF3C68B|nr:hypothetical protein [Clostridium algoriphilum]MCB2294201.1 hypothetical protein [Clostridium algoriphilum]
MAYNWHLSKGKYISHCVIHEIRNAAVASKKGWSGVFYGTTYTLTNNDATKMDAYLLNGQYTKDIKSGKRSKLAINTILKFFGYGFYGGCKLFCVFSLYRQNN